MLLYHKTGSPIFNKIGFLNPPLKNICWLNSSLRFLFNLPIFMELDSFRFKEKPSNIVFLALQNIQKNLRLNISNKKVYESIM